MTADAQRLILRATAGNVREHVIVSMGLGTQVDRWSFTTFGVVLPPDSRKDGLTGFQRSAICPFGRAVD